MPANIGHDTRRMREIKTKGFPWYVIESLLFDNGYQAVVLYRIAHWFKAHRMPLFGPLFGRLNLWLTGCDIAPAAEFGPGLRITHGQGIVVGAWTKAGKNCHLLQGVTLGAPSGRRITEMPTLGDDVYMAAYSAAIGAIEIGDRVFVGIQAVITEDVPSDSKVKAVSPPRVETATGPQTA
jgi:serine O-acetyltransferase